MARVQAVPGDWPARRLRERIREFLAELPQAIAGKEDAVHDMRVAGRRLRVALVVLPARPYGGRAGRARRLLRGLISAAGMGRDADVSLELLRQIAPPRRSSRPAALLRRRLRGTRSRQRRRMSDALLDQPIARLRRDLLTLLRKGADTHPVVTERLRREAGRFAEEIVGGLGVLGGRFEADELHDVRREVRKLRYLTELVVSSDPGRNTGQEIPVRLRELQEDLGKLHDAWLLANWLARQAASTDRRTTPEIAEEARRLQSLCLEACRERHGEFLARDPVGVVRTALALAGAEEAAWNS